MVSALRRHLVITVVILIGGSIVLGLPRSSATSKKDEGSSSAITQAVVRHSAEHYVEPDRVEPPEQLKAALIALEKAVPEVLVDWTPGQEALTIHVSKTTRRVAVPSLQSIGDIVPVLRSVYRIVQAHMVSDLEWPRIEYSTVNGMLQSLDPHSVLLTPGVNKEFRLSAKGSFGGLGIVIGIRDGELTVISPLEGTPAYRAGIRSKDKIVQVEDESTVNMDLIEAVGKLRGDPGTAVTISIMREGLSD
ncbi:MAG: PDZ domain-containing protein, partial [bacterium]